LAEIAGSDFGRHQLRFRRQKAGLDAHLPGITSAAEHFVASSAQGLLSAALNPRA
jgi:hypothetical protein